MMVPDLFEFTFVLRSEYRFEHTSEPFPGPLDTSNHEGREDYPLDPLVASNLPTVDPGIKSAI